VAFKGSPAEAVEFLRGIVEGRTQPPTLVPLPVAMRPSSVGEAKRLIRRVRGQRKVGGYSSPSDRKDACFS